MITATPQLLNVLDVANILKCSRSGVWAKASKIADFPKPFKLSAKQTRWYLSELSDYIASKMSTREEKEN